MKMTSPPWKAKFSAFPEIQPKADITNESGQLHIAQTYGFDTDENTFGNAKAIVLAINNTYGQQINPEGVKALYDSCEACLDYLSTKYPSEAHILHQLKYAIEKAKL